MFELWIDKGEPSVRLVTKAGSSLPAEFGPRDWKNLGPIEPDAAAAAQVEALGYHFFHSDEPAPDPASLKNANASGQ